MNELEEEDKISDFHKTAGFKELKNQTEAAEQEDLVRTATRLFLLKTVFTSGRDFPRHSGLDWQYEFNNEAAEFLNTVLAIKWPTFDPKKFLSSVG